MNARRLLRLGCAGGMALLVLAGCATGSAGQRPGVSPPPGGEQPTSSNAPPSAAPSVSAPPSASGTEPAATAAAAPEAPVAVPAQEASAAAVPPAEAVPSSAARASDAGGEKMLPPCVPVNRTHSKHRKPKQSPAPQTAVPTGPPPPAPADAVVDAQVGEEDSSLSSILGKDVKSPKGEDLGRVIDVLADARGHVRVAIIDFGGFLGVGTRRIAVDWPLLHFDPDSHDKPLILSVDRQKLQSAPEYNSKRLRVLMPPAAPDANDAGQTKK
jgi:PRC-barrel domain protein